MDIVERLRGHAKNNAGGVKELLVLSANEIERLRQQVAELVNALQTISKWQPSSTTQPRQKIIDNMQLYASLSVTKATGGE